MGLFGIGNSTSVWDFEQKLKNDPDFMLKVLNLFDGNPTASSLTSGFKKLGFSLDLQEALKALAKAIAYYKEKYGDQFDSGSSSGSGSKSFMGFSQD